MQNLPVHFDNPEFRSDMLNVIAKSLGKIDSMCSRLSLLRENPELHLSQGDVGELVKTTIASLDGSLKGSIVSRIQPGSLAPMDGEQLQKVLLNLILNANEAIVSGGEITVEVRRQEYWLVVSVSDNGCGMSQEFMEQSLFRPFKTTKERGLGIGLYHSKTIVEAHGGKIEVESEEGQGSTFRVMLPRQSGQSEAEQGRLREV